MKNKRRIVIFSMFLFMMLLFSVVDVTANDRFDAPSERNVFALPASLKQIDDSAFEGTNPSYVFLPESIEQISDSSFDRISNKLKVVVPEYTYSFIDGNLSDDFEYQVLDYSDQDAKVGAGKNGMYFDPFLIHHSTRSRDSGNSGDKNHMEMLSRARDTVVQKYKVCRSVMRTIPYEIRNSETYVQALDFL